jgi:heme/copper-type cytochrome/quinol oxidase subunit 2
MNDILLGILIIAAILIVFGLLEWLVIVIYRKYKKKHDAYEFERGYKLAEHWLAAGIYTVEKLELLAYNSIDPTKFDEGVNAYLFEYWAERVGMPMRDEP